MHWSKRLASALLLVLPLAACDALRHQAPGSLVVRDAAVASVADGAELVLDIDCRLNGPMSDALEHGIPITLRIDVHARATGVELENRRQVELRYFPLTRRYQLRDTGADGVRSFPGYEYLTDALASLRLPLPHSFARLPAGTRLRVEVGLDHAALPGALRLPAILAPAWHLSAPEFAWTVAAG